MIQIPRDTRAFTLVELLVVISIIALLLSIMMPALNTAREQGRQMACMANIKQLGLATAAYSTVTGYLPVRGIYKGPGDGVADASNDPILGPSNPMFPKISNWKDGNCFGTPASCLIKNGDLSDTKAFLGACPSSKPFLKISYGYNYTQLGSSSRWGWTPMNGKEWVKAILVQRPSETAMFCDGGTVGPPGIKPAIGNWVVSYWDPSGFPDYKGVKTANSYPIIGHRKGQQININFVDGHSTSMAPKPLHLERLCVFRPTDKGDYFWKRVKTDNSAYHGDPPY